MSTRDTLQIGNPKLKALNAEIKNFKSSVLKQLITDLKDTMLANDLVGMAAPQIGENYKVFITEPRVTPTRTIDQSDKFRVYINPVITKYSNEEIIIYEGCGSVINGKLFGPVMRPKQITIEAYDENKKKFQLTCDGLLARVIQHEYDHLTGIEFTEKINDYRLLMDDVSYKARIKLSPLQVENSKITVKKYKSL